YVNGKRVDTKLVVRPGDHLEVGPMRFVVEYEMTQEVLERLTSDGSVVMAEVVEEPRGPAKGDQSRNPFAFNDKKQSNRRETVEEVEEAELVAPGDDDEALPFAEEEEFDQSLRLPPNAQLRDILSEMSGPSSRPKPLERREE